MKKFHRFNQVVSQTLGRSEKSDVLTGDLPNVDQRVAAMVKALEHTKKKLQESLRSAKPSSAKEEVNLEKRKKTLDEYKLSQAIINDARSIESAFVESAFVEKSLLSEVMAVSADALGGIADETVQYEMQVEQHVLEKLTKFHEDLENIVGQKQKLKKLVLDMDSARTRLNAAQSRGERTNEIQDELDSAEKKVESHQDSLACDLYSLASKEVDMAVLFRMLLQIQMDYHRSALKRLEEAEPSVAQKIDVFPRRPVYGCPLEDHLRYSAKEIAVVLEDCCSALVELGLKDEGLFRIPGNVTKIRRLKTAFDAGEVDFGDFVLDPHAIAGALKLYLRELPDSLMTNNLYRDWINAVSISNLEPKLAAIKEVIKKLPPCNYTNLCYLVKFLAKLADNQHITKMSAQNLAIVMAPNMIRSTTDAEGFGMNNVHGNLVEILISNANFFFPGNIQFSSSHVSALVDKTGGFLQNGPIAHAATLSLSVAKAIAEDIANCGDGQLSPNKGNTRRPKQPAPPPPPILPEHAMVRSSNNVGSRFMDASRSAATDESFSSNEDDDFDFSPEDSVEQKKKPLPARPQSLAPHQLPEPTTTQGAKPAFVAGHRKTLSLDRPTRPPPRVTPDSAVNTSFDRQRNGGPRPFPKQEELDELLMAGFGESAEDGKRPSESSTNKLPKPLQPQRPPLPNKMVMAAVCEPGQPKVDGPTSIRVLESDESEDEEPVVKSMEQEHIYYDVPDRKSQYSPPSRPSADQHRDNPVALLSVSKSQEGQSSTSSKKTSPSSSKDDKVVPRNSVDGGTVAQRRESLMKLMASDQQAGQSIREIPMRPRPPLPSKPRANEPADKDATKM